MKKTVVLFTLLFSLTLSSCVYVSLPESSDPAEKLEEAQRYMAQGQPLPAERLITEAIRIYETENNPEALGNAYRDFAAFLQSPSVAQREHTYREAGFLEAGITYDNRYDKAAEYLEKALAQYDIAATRYQNTGRFDQLSTLYYRQAGIYLLQHQPDKACLAYDQSRLAYAENAVRNTAAYPVTPGGYASWHDAIAAAKKQAGCRN